MGLFLLPLYSTGITPLCYVLFALYNPQSCCWYSPNHVFSPEENSCLVLHYYMRLVCFQRCASRKRGTPLSFHNTNVSPFVYRFYFQNWHGLNKNEPAVSRYCLRNRPEQGLSPLLDIMSLEYLFAQVCGLQRCLLVHQLVVHHQAVPNTCLLSMSLYKGQACICERRGADR